MQFTDELADEIIGKFHLDPKTKKSWKNRGAIPDKYKDATYSPPVSSKHSTDIMRMKEILSLPEIAQTKFAFGKRGQDMKEGEARITEEEFLQFKSEVVQLRNKLRDGADRNKFLHLLSDPRIHPTKLLTLALYDRISRKMDLFPSEKEEARFAFLRLYNLLRL